MAPNTREIVGERRKIFFASFNETNRAISNSAPNKQSAAKKDLSSYIAREKASLSCFLVANAQDMGRKVEDFQFVYTFHTNILYAKKANYVVLG